MLIKSYLHEFFVSKRDFVGLDVSTVDVLIQENDGRLSAAVEKLYVVDLKLIHPGKQMLLS